MRYHLVVILTSSLLVGCSSGPQGAAIGASVGALAGTVLGSVTGMDRTTATLAGAVIGGAVGYQRGRMIEARIGEVHADAIRRETGLNPSLTIENVRHRSSSGRITEVPVVKQLEMNVAEHEMLMADGRLHPPAARALARMNDMVREYGGEFAVYVPRSQLDSIQAIRAVAPNATIYEANESDDYRLVVIPSVG